MDSNVAFDTCGRWYTFTSSRRIPCANLTEPDTRDATVDKFLIEGGVRLDGEVRASGAKNAALPILASSLLTAETLALRNVPQLEDVETTKILLAQMGVEGLQGYAIERPIPLERMTQLAIRPVRESSRMP